jgi:hypothetical protein
MFLVDNERGKDIEIGLGGGSYAMDPSEPNGHFRGEVRVERSELSDRKEGDWIMFQAIMPEKDDRLFQGKVHLIGPRGISVISDIDDTIKVSNVKDKKALLANTFLKAMSALSVGLSYAFDRQREISEDSSCVPEISIAGYRRLAN